MPCGASLSLLHQSIRGHGTFIKPVQPSIRHPKNGRSYPMRGFHVLLTLDHKSSCEGLYPEIAGFKSSKSQSQPLCQQHGCHRSSLQMIIPNSAKLLLSRYLANLSADLEHTSLCSRSRVIYRQTWYHRSHLLPLNTCGIPYFIDPYCLSLQTSLQHSIRCRSSRMWIKRPRTRIS